MALANSFFGFRAGHLLVIEFVIWRSNLTWCPLSFLDFIATVFFMVLGVLDQHVFVLVEPVVLGFTIFLEIEAFRDYFGLYRVLYFQCQQSCKLF